MISLGKATKDTNILSTDASAFAVEQIDNNNFSIKSKSGTGDNFIILQENNDKDLILSSVAGPNHSNNGIILYPGTDRNHPIKLNAYSNKVFIGDDTLDVVIDSHLEEEAYLLSTYDNSNATTNGFIYDLYEISNGQIGKRFVDSISIRNASSGSADSTNKDTYLHIFKYNGSGDKYTFANYTKIGVSYNSGVRSIASGTPTFMEFKFDPFLLDFAEDIIVVIPSAQKTKEGIPNSITIRYCGNWYPNKDYSTSVSQHINAAVTNTSTTFSVVSSTTNHAAIGPIKFHSVKYFPANIVLELTQRIESLEAQLNN